MVFARCARQAAPTASTCAVARAHIPAAKHGHDLSHVPKQPQPCHRLAQSSPHWQNFSQKLKDEAQGQSFPHGPCGSAHQDPLRGQSLCTSKRAGEAIKRQGCGCSPPRQGRGTRKTKRTDQARAQQHTHRCDRTARSSEGHAAARLAPGNTPIKIEPTDPAHQPPLVCPLPAAADNSSTVSTPPVAPTWRTIPRSFGTSPLVPPPEDDVSPLAGSALPGAAAPATSDLLRFSRAAIVCSTRLRSSWLFTFERPAAARQGG